MKDRKEHTFPCNSFFFIIIIFLIVFFSGFSFSSIRFLFRFRDRFHQELIQSATTVIKPISGDIPVISIRETVVFPDQVLIFLNYPSSLPQITQDSINCIYSSPNSTTQSQLKLSPITVDEEPSYGKIVRCPPLPRGLILSSIAVGLPDVVSSVHVSSTHRWNSVAYEALIDRDNTTVVFVKGFNLRQARVYNSSLFECVYGWDFTRFKFLLRSEVISIGQEIVRCKTPLTILSGGSFGGNDDNPIKVSVRMKGKGIIRSVARPGQIRLMTPDPTGRKEHLMCVCTMLMNQARFMKEWVMYHSHIGIQRWFIYDNNSDDDIEKVIGSLNNSMKYNITRHLWPWIKTQEAGFAHCAIRARDSCEWVGFIDVDEFLHLPLGQSLHEVLTNQSMVDNNIGELRMSCHSFGPSGRKKDPSEGVIAGYTCRMAQPERHKSIVRVDAVNSSLINLVHHFHLREGFRHINMDRNVMVINHYKYQVWQVFKEKFRRRVATYVTNWEEDQNAGSKDRTPGLGTRAIEPLDWSSWFCEVNDTRLRDRVINNFRGILPWKEL